MNEMRSGKYRHYKGNEYEIIGIAKHSETLEEMIVYRSVYDKNSLWVRPKDMFFETVVINGVEVSRFEYLGGWNGKGNWEKVSSEIWYL